MDFKLNEEQQKIVSNNTGLIYSFAKDYHLDLEEYYGILAEGLCRAAYLYDYNRSWSFSKFAYVCMRSITFSEYNKTTKREKDCWKRNNIDAPIHFESLHINTEDRIETEQESSEIEYRLQPILNPYDDIELDIVFNQFYNSLKDREKRMIDLLKSGRSLTDIGKELGISRQAVSSTKIKLQNKFKSIYLRKKDLSYKKVMLR